MYWLSLFIFSVPTVYSQIKELKVAKKSEEIWNKQFENYLNFHTLESLMDIKTVETSENERNWLQSLDRGIKNFRHKRQIHSGSGFLRKEIRMLTLEERRRFFNALNALKNDTTVTPNMYDFIALFHTRSDIVRRSHFGPSFLGWHRIYLLRLEFALKQKDARVSLPYWDSSIEGEMEDATISILWTPSFFGNAFNEVERGPFGHWTTPDGQRLRRNIGFLGSLIRRSDIEGMIVNARNHSDVVRSGFDSVTFSESTIEAEHDNVHAWVGGTMSGLLTAAFDPLFFLHHCFIDLIWEKLREGLRQKNVDPESDYPDTIGDQAAGSPMYLFDFLRNIDGYSDRWTRQFYQYDNQPSCSGGTQGCSSEYLRCAPTRSQPENVMCTSLTSNYVLDVSPRVRYKSAILDIETTVGPRFTSSTNKHVAGLFKLISPTSPLSRSEISKLAFSILKTPNIFNSIPEKTKQQLIIRMFSMGL
uniref:Tyrosinase 3 n=1 Tax=Pinctada fucata TaxID=50426 RepID=A0A8F4Q4J9_PINFU|nr:tyrosinase 3 [Pinctada fucata]